MRNTQAIKFLNDNFLYTIEINFNSMIIGNIALEESDQFKWCFNNLGEPYFSTENIGNDCYHVNNELNKWDVWWDARYNNFIFYFKFKEDASLFKLVWG